MFEWFRAIHIIGVIAWMAGLMIYPRLLVYRMEAQGDARFEAAMDKAAGSTRKIILTPTMVIVWLMGLAMIGDNWEFYITQVWF
jgi:putative membrane protein